MRRIGRRAFCAQAFAFAAAVAYGVCSKPARSAQAASALDAERLRSELRVTTQAQGKYVDDVVEKVEKGELPYKIFITAYKYAMKRDASKRPYYFKLCTEQLAKKSGLRLDFPSV